MSPVLAFIIGLLVGWVIEWIIDWVFWRRNQPVDKTEDLEACRGRVNELQHELLSYQNQLANLQAERDREVPVRAQYAAELPVERNVPIAEQAPARDLLEEIQGITSEMARRLNEARIETFAALAALTPQRLKEILGDLITRPGGEVEIVRQARITSGMIKRADNLEVIVGIGPVIARTLNNAGIFTFADLASLSVNDLRDIVGARIERLADEEDILSQARQLADNQSQGG